MRALTYIMNQLPTYKIEIEQYQMIAHRIQCALEWNRDYKTFAVGVQDASRLHVWVDSGWEFSSDCKDACTNDSNLMQVSKAEMKAILAYMTSTIKMIELIHKASPMPSQV